MAMTNAEKQAAYRRRLKERLGDAEAPHRERLEFLQSKVAAFDDYLIAIKAIVKSRGIAAHEKTKMLMVIVNGWERMDDTDKC